MRLLWPVLAFQSHDQLHEALKMSALTPHIRSHRAMAQSFRDTAATTDTECVAAMLLSMAETHERTAAKLETDEREMMNRLVSIPSRAAS